MSALSGVGPLSTLGALEIVASMADFFLLILIYLNANIKFYLT